MASTARVVVHHDSYGVTYVPERPICNLHTELHSVGEIGGGGVGKSSCRGVVAK